MYEEIYYHTYCENKTGREARLSIRKRGFAGTATYVDAGPVPFTKALADSDYNLVGGIYPTMARIQLIGNETFGMDDLATADDSEFLIEHYLGGDLDWSGFLVPEGFGELDRDTVRTLNINAFDGLTRLKGVKFLQGDQNYGVADGEFRRSFLYTIKEALKKTGLSLEILTLVDRLPVTGGGTFAPFTVQSLNTNWVYSTGFNSLDENLVAVGNYLAYQYQNEPGVYYSLIVDVDRSEVGDGGGTGILLSPPMREGLSQPIEAYFFEATGNSSEDVLTVAEQDMRVWIDPDTEVKRESKSDEDRPYYDFTDGTWTAWDVLEAIAKVFDFRLTQNQGRWVAQAMDINRVSDDYFAYTEDGVFIAREVQEDNIVIPACYDEDFYREEGNERYIDKTLKSTSVQYNYRFKVQGDPLISQLLNGGFQLPFNNTEPPETFTPAFWTRYNGGITFNISRPLNLAFLNITTPNAGFNAGSFLLSTPIPATKGDSFDMSWMQSILTFSTTSMASFYFTMMVRFITESGERHYLVNSQDEPGWTDMNMMSGNPVGQWIKSDSNPYFFLSDFSTDHNPTPGGNYSEMSQVNLTIPEVPDNGNLQIGLVGVTWAPNDDNGDTLVNAYVADNRGLVEGKVAYIENNDRNRTANVIWNKREFGLGVRIANMDVGRIPSGERGSGRVYNYTQGGNYFDTIPPVSIDVGDENNTDHLSNITVGGSPSSVWVSRDGSLQAGPIGLVLARALMRRYYRPRKRIDGGFGFYPLDVTQMINIGTYPDKDWYISTGELSMKTTSFQGTLFEMSKEVLPPGGQDLGPNSYGSSSSSSGSSSSGGGGGGGGGTPVGQAPSLEQVTSSGNQTVRDIWTKGTRNELLLAVPDQPVLPEDILPEETYLHASDGYVYLDGSKAKAGDSDKWGGNTFADFINQALRTESDVGFANVESGGFKVAAMQTAPASATATGTPGEIRITATHIYVCISDNVWVRSELSTW